MLYFLSFEVKVDVGIMSHLSLLPSLLPNFSKENSWNEAEVTLQHNEDVAIPKIKSILGYSISTFTTPYEIHFRVSDGIMSRIKNVTFKETHRCTVTLQLLDAARHNKPTCFFVIKHLF